MREPLEATLVVTRVAGSIIAAWAPRIALKLDNVAAAPCIRDAHTDRDSAIATHTNKISPQTNQAHKNLLTLSRLEMRDEARISRAAAVPSGEWMQCYEIDM